MTKPFLAKSLLVLLLAVGNGVQAGAPLGATEMTQLANNAELIAMYGEEAKQLAELIKTYTLMVKEAEKLPELVERNAINALMNLARNTQMGMAITYAKATVGEDLKAAYFDFDQYVTFLETADSKGKSEQYEKLLRTTYDTVEATLKNSSLQAAMFEDESVAVAKIQEQMRTATGQNQIMQAAGSLAAANIEQQQKLRQLVMGLTNTVGVGVAAEMDQRARAEAALERMKKCTVCGPSTTKPTPVEFNLK